MPRIVLDKVTGAGVPGKTGVTLLARLRMTSGALVTRASLSSIAYTVSDLTSGEALGTGTFTVSSTVFDSLQQNDLRWHADSLAAPGADGASGFNFLATVPASLFALETLEAPGVLTGTAAPRSIQCDVAFTPATGEAFRVVFRWTQQAVYG
jgi:hypothetical protein